MVTGEEPRDVWERRALLCLRRSACDRVPEVREEAEE